MSQKSRNRGKSAGYEALEPRNLLATYLVDTPVDVVDPGDGLLSLREAISLANSNQEDDEIVLGEATYEIAIPGINDNENLSGDFDITSDGSHQLIIRGEGMNKTIIDGGGIDRVFEIFFESQVTFDHLHVTGGSDAQQDINTGRRGGGIRSGNANLVLNQVKMTDNDTGDWGVGGALHIAGGQFEITDSVFTSNSSDIAGSAIFLRETSGTIAFAQISENQSNKLLRGFSNSTIESRSSDITLDRVAVRDNSRGLYAVGGNLEIESSRFRRHGDAEGSTSFFGRPYALKTIDTDVSIDTGIFNANENAIEFDGAESDLSIDGVIFHGNFKSTLFKGRSIVVSNSTYRWQTAGIAAIELENVSLSESPDLSSRVAAIENTVFEFNRTHGIRGSIAILNISGSRFEGNHEDGVHVSGDRLSVRDSTFLDQRAWAHGVYYIGEQVEIASSTFRGNGNSPVYVAQSGQVYVTHSRFISNTGRGSGGALRFSPFFPDSRIVISNSIISQNQVRPAFNPDGSQYAEGGAIGIRFPTEMSNYELIVSSSTIVKNWAAFQGGALASNLSVDHNVQINNSIFWGNKSPSQRLATTGLDVVAKHSTFWDGRAGDGIVPFGGISNGIDDRFPQFVDWSGNDFQLTLTSPGVDSGNNDLLLRDSLDVDGDMNTTEFATDFLRRNRLLGGTTDRGAFELQN